MSMRAIVQNLGHLWILGMHTRKSIAQTSYMEHVEKIWNEKGVH